MLPECNQPGGPELPVLFRPGCDFPEAFEARAAMTLATLLNDSYEPAFDKDLQVFRHGRPADLEIGGEGIGSHRRICQQPNDRPAPRIGYCLKNISAHICSRSVTNVVKVLRRCIYFAGLTRLAERPPCRGKHSFANAGDVIIRQVNLVGTVKQAVLVGIKPVNEAGHRYAGTFPNGPACKSGLLACQYIRVAIDDKARPFRQV